MIPITAAMAKMVIMTIKVVDKVLSREGWLQHNAPAFNLRVLYSFQPLRIRLGDESILD